MNTVRRWYLSIVSLVSLQVITWATLALLRQWLAPSSQFRLTDRAILFAVVLVATPFFLVHWIWFSRVARSDEEERRALLRRLYLLATMSTFLGVAIAQLVLAASKGWYLLFNVEYLPSWEATRAGLTLAQELTRHAVAAILTAVLWSYHLLVMRRDRRHGAADGTVVAADWLYRLAFTGAGVALTAVGSTILLRWILYLPDGPDIANSTASIPDGLAYLPVGLLLWFFCWRLVTRLSKATIPVPRDRPALLRQIYLYLVIFLSVLASVLAATILLASLLHDLLDVPTSGDIRDILSWLLPAGAIWAFHAFVLHRQQQVAFDRPQRLAVRRLYRYLVAGIGLLVLLIGLGGLVSVAIRLASGDPASYDMRTAIGWFAAALAAGLPVWFLHWRPLQLEGKEYRADADSGATDIPLASVVRRIYLYIFLLLATLTVLGTAIYIVDMLFRRMLLGVWHTSGWRTDLVQAGAYALIACLVWLYHGTLVRRDTRQLRALHATLLNRVAVTVVSEGDWRIGTLLMHAIRQATPALRLSLLSAAPTQDDAFDAKALDELANSQVIVLPWTLLLPGATSEATASVIEAIARSSAQKVLVPVSSEGWKIPGVEEDEDTVAKDTAIAVRQIAMGELAAPFRIGIGTVAAVLLILLIGLPLLVGAIASLSF